MDVAPVVKIAAGDADEDCLACEEWDRSHMLPANHTVPGRTSARQAGPIAGDVQRLDCDVGDTT